MFFDKTPLQMAIIFNNIEIVKILLQNEKLDINFIFVLLKYINKI